jgi:hypothetical protein
MRAHQTIDVVTGKRTYKNMLIVDISTKTDHTTEYALFLDVHFQEVIRVETLSTTQPAMSNQPLANRTAATTNGTAQQPIPKPKSSLSRTLNYVAPNNPNPWNPVTGGPS